MDTQQEVEEAAFADAVDALTRLFAPQPDAVALVGNLSGIRVLCDWYELSAMASLRHYGSSWGDLAAPWGMSRQGVQDRYDRLAVRVMDAGLDLPRWAAEGAFAGARLRASRKAD